MNPLHPNSRGPVGVNSENASTTIFLLPDLVGATSIPHSKIGPDYFF